MEILVGRITADAKISTLSDERKVVNFSIAINDSFKPKGTEQSKKVVAYVNCSYWISTGIADHLTKGALVEICGRISARAYIALNGEARASLDFHVNNIKLHGKGAQKEDPAQGTEPKPAPVPTGMHDRKKSAMLSPENIVEPLDDLPF